MKKPKLRYDTFCNYLQTCQIKTPAGYGCICSEGYYLSGQKCVDKLACGCVQTDYDAKYYREVQIVFKIPNLFIKDSQGQRIEEHISKSILAKRF